MTKNISTLEFVYANFVEKARQREKEIKAIMDKRIQKIL